MLYASPDSPRQAATITDPKRSAGGWIGRIGAPTEMPAWLTQEELDYYVGEFTRAGFRGGINYYRNFDANWHFMEDKDPAIQIPSAFISGAADTVIGGADVAALTAMMTPAMTDLREVTLIPEIGHWVQQEAPQQTNDAILRFIKSL